MATNTDGGTTASLSNTPQAKADTFYRSEDLTGVTLLDVMLNDLGGNAKILWSVDDSSTDAAGSTDLICTDVGKVESTSSDTSANGAKIWIQDGQVAYQSDSLSAAFKAALQSLAVGQTISDTFTYAIRLSNGTLSWNTATIVFTGVNDGPVATADSNGGDAVVEAGVNPGNTPYPGDPSASGNLLANDTDVDNGAVLTVKDVNGSAANVGSAITGTYGSVTINADGSWDYVLNNGDSDTQQLAQGETVTETFSYTVTDQHGATATSTLTITITGTNDGPVANADSDTTGENAVLTVDVLANDTDVDNGAVLTVTAASAPAGQGSASIVSNQVRFDPGTDFDYLADGDTATVTVNYTIQDEHGASSSSTLSITVTGTNDAPVVASPIADQSSAEDAAWSFTVPAGSFADVDNATLTYSASLGNGDPLPAWLSFNAATQTFSGAPPLNFDGQLDLKVTASDGEYSVSDTFTLDITPVNDAPVVASPIADQSSAEDAAWSFTVPAGSFADVDNATLTYSASLGNGDPLPAWLSFNATTQTFSGTPPLNFDGQLDLKVTASDGEYSVSDTFTLDITPVNDAPVAVDDTASTDEDNSVLINVLANDADPESDVLSITAASVTSGLGTVTIEAGQLRYNPGTSYNGLGSGQTATVVLSYTIADGQGGNDTASVTVTVTGAADGVAPPPTETGADPNDFDTLVGTGAANNTAMIVGSNVLGDNITGGSADQDINGRGGNDTIYGAGGSDDIDGGADNDTLYGQAGTDDISGNNGFDTVYGGSGNDDLIGGNEADTLFGGSGNDTIVGNNGDDVIIGGYGLDTLTGGGENDTFRYLSTLDTNDIIVDFMASGNDQIDVSAIDATPGGVDDPFDWGGDTATANGLWFSYDAGTNTTVLYGDTDGDTSTAEFMLTLQNYSGLNTFSTPLTPPPDITL